MTTSPPGPADPLPVTDREWEALGEQAFHNGDHAAPALNPTVMAALEGLPVGGGGARIMAAFGRGWMAANLAAPVPGVNGDGCGEVGGGGDIRAATGRKPGDR